MNNILFFDKPLIILGGLFVGFIFGFLLQKGKVANFNTIVGQMLLKDFTVAKIMLTAILVGGIGLYSAKFFGLISEFSLNASPSLLVILSGGLIFGVGMSILGYCPGTCIAAMGEGAVDAWFGFLGMIQGAIVFAYLYPWINKNFLEGGKISEVFVYKVLGVSPWLLFIIIGAGAIFLFRFLESKKL